MADLLVERVQQVWTGLAGTPAAAFRSGVLQAVVAARSQLCPPGWVGAVAIGGAALVTAPDQDAAEQVTRVLAHLTPEQVTDPTVVSQRLPVTQVLGPAWLSYLGPAVRPPRPRDTAVLRVAADHGDLAGLRAALSPEDLAESGLEDLTSDVFVVRRDGIVVAAAGHRRWPHRVAHLSVLTAPAARGQGLAGRVARAAVDDAVAQGLLPQWRARPAASRRVAARLGFRELGSQLSFRVDPARP